MTTLSPKSPMAAAFVTQFNQLINKYVNDAADLLVTNEEYDKEKILNAFTKIADNFTFTEIKSGGGKGRTKKVPAGTCTAILQHGKNAGKECGKNVFEEGPKGELLCTRHAKIKTKAPTSKAPAKGKKPAGGKAAKSKKEDDSDEEPEEKPKKDEDPEEEEPEDDEPEEDGPEEDDE